MIMKLLRWLLFVPAGLFEAFLIILSMLLTVIGLWHLTANGLAMEIIKYGNTMPGLKWYFGSDT